MDTWKDGAKRAPNKPLMTLLLLGRASRGENPELSYAEFDPRLRGLLRAFGSPRTRPTNTHYPFLRLQSEQIWLVKDAERYKRTSSGDLLRSELKRSPPVGYVPPALWRVIRDDAGLRDEVVVALLDEFWPATLPAAIRQAVGIPDVATTLGGVRRIRKPQFRAEVLRAYDRRCAVCGYDGKLGDTTLALEAAHVQWHAHDGPDEVTNGLALCSYHHVAFDTGAIGVTRDRRVCVAAEAHGQTMVDEFLLRFSGAALRAPQGHAQRLADEHIEWHAREVFREPARAFAKAPASGESL